ncbi:KH domain-containing protein [Candidatus Kaiserbacteria bacterium]|nr:KH domain-containing protein [Candidatus Kaiserbacteria bacterium]
MAVEKDQEFLEFVVKGLVEHPAEVQVNRVVDEMGVLLTLNLNAEDMGKVIGRSGNTAKAIRTLLRVVGMKHNARVNLKINEPAGGRIDGAGPSGGAAAQGWDGTHEPAATPQLKSVDEAMDELSKF